MHGILRSVLGCTVVCLLVVAFGPGRAAAKTERVPFPDVPRMGVEELKTLMDTSDVTVLDVRPFRQFEQSKQKIRGAIYEDPLKVEEWLPTYQKEKHLVTYCA